MKMAAKFKNILMWLFMAYNDNHLELCLATSKSLQDVLVSVILGAGLVVLKKFLKI